MTTALQIIDRAYSLLGYKAAGEVLSSAFGLRLVLAFP